MIFEHYQMKLLSSISKFTVLAVLLAMLPDFNLSAQQDSSRKERREKKVMHLLQDLDGFFIGWHHTGKPGLDSLEIRNDQKQLILYLSPDVAHLPVRAPWVGGLRDNVKNQLPRRYRDYRITFYVKGKLLEDYVPQYFRSPYLGDDATRMSGKTEVPPLVQGKDAPQFPKGLQGNHIALWPSHGYYFEASLNRWEWQRARLFTTVEDIYPYAFIHTFLIPMLQNSGAQVLMPRERDIQIHEVVVDNDGSSPGSQILVRGGLETDTLWPGFVNVDTLFQGINSFQEGSLLKLASKNSSEGRLVYLPNIPEDGYFSVSVSWGHHIGASDSVEYVVNHSGGETRFVVNQTMGFGTWIYLGNFHFLKGSNEQKGSVSVLVPAGLKEGITTDAVRFGGGMGTVARRPSGAYTPNRWSLNDDNRETEVKKYTDTLNYNYKLSGKPRWMEGARYWLQYAGMPDTLVYSLNENKNDYNDDYQSRGEWVNYLMGAPFGPTAAPDSPGLNIPIDLAFAFHTDAGTTPGDSVIGTLGIYSSERTEGFFPEGQSRLASRDLTDLVQSQIVTDIRLLFNDQWTRRAMWDKQYSEAWRPNVPTMLLELLSHQNLADMQFGLDPQFQFTVARAVYKGMARFLAAHESRKVVIQPLAPDHMAIEILENKKVKISWRPVSDLLEPTAYPSGYRVFKRVGQNGFDNGILTTDTFLIVELEDYKTLYSFKVAALNEGGQSFPGETLSVSLAPDGGNPVLVVNGFDRLAPPAFVDGNAAGIASWEDEGVPYMQNLGYTGSQYDFNRSSPWLDDDSPGHGASHADQESKPVQGNSFDFTSLHGQALANAGYSVVSVSDEVFEQEAFDVTGLLAVDLIFGEERGTFNYYRPGEKDFRILTPAMRAALGRYLESGGNVFMSGAYLGTDMVENQDSAAIDFAGKYLHYAWRTNHASNKGLVLATDEYSSILPDTLLFNSSWHPDLYKVEAPDGLEPIGEGAKTIYRYFENNVSAGVAFSGKYRTLILGFPFETIKDAHHRDLLMKGVLGFFERNSNGNQKTVKDER